MSSAQNTTGAQDWSDVYEAVQWIQVVMAGFSVLGSGSIVCLLSQRLRRRPELQPLFLLSVSDLLLAACWLVGAALYSQHSCSLSRYCYNLHTVEQILYMASFLYTLNYVWTLFTAIREKYDSFQDGYPVQVYNRVSTPAKITALLSCVLPVLLMVPMSVLGNISQCQANYSEPYRCLLMHTGALFLTREEQQPISTCSVLNTVNIVIFLTAFLVTLLGITVFVVKARRIYRRVVTSHGYLGSEQRASFCVLDRRMLLYPLVFIICWGPAVSLAFLSVVKPSVTQGKAGVVLYISEALTSASQGFFNSLVYGWTHLTFRRATMAAFRRDVDTQTPLLRKQKKRCYQSLRSVC
ncbi:transmembrane protein 116 [Parambassis ranga]|uniref:Transmembrane protein 116 n=1 Tax=Parambassis ranga TaxID=210632 RepID=A0A6P7JY21_9TELE|nr:transmembrane protein 116 [Parambassis ranga]